MKLLLLSIISTFLFTSCSGQTNAPTSIIGEVALNIPPNTWIVFQDSKNNYWFGSDGEGVYKYDGKILTHIYSKQGLVSDRVREIKEDKLGNIYINTLDGISRFDGKKLATLVARESASGNNWKLQPGDLWFKGTHGPLRYDGKNLYSLRFPKSEKEDDYHKRFPGTSIDPYDVYYIYQDRKGHMWFGTGAFGIYRYDGKNILNLYEDHLTNVPNGGSFGIRSIIEDKMGRYWFCNSKYRFNILPGVSEKGKGFINYTKEKGFDIENDDLGGDRIYFQSVAEDNNGNLWLQTYRGGIWRYDGKEAYKYPVKNGAKEVNVIAMYQDRQGGLWLGTQESGVYKFNGKDFVKFKF